MTTIIQGTSFNQTFILVSSTDHISPLLGASPTVLISKAGGSFATASGTAYEVGNGWYAIPLGPVDTNTVGELSFHCTATGADDTDFSDQVISSGIIINPTPQPIQTGIGVGIGPYLGGFIEFVTNVMNPPVPFVPSTSIYVVYAYNIAIQYVNTDLSLVPGALGAWTLYAQAVYNYAADTLIAIAQDQPSDPVYKNDLKYWAWLRKEYNTLAFIPGIVQSSSDEGTSVGYDLPKGYEGYTIGDIQNTKSPFGRAYLAYASSWGSLWGLS